MRKKFLELRDRKNGFLAITYNYSGYPMVQGIAQYDPKRNIRPNSALSSRDAAGWVYQG